MPDGFCNRLRSTLHKRALTVPWFIALWTGTQLALTLLLNGGLGNQDLSFIQQLLLYASLVALTSFEATLFVLCAGKVKGRLLCSTTPIAAFTLAVFLTVIITFAACLSCIYGLSWFSHAVGLGLLDYSILVTVFDELNWLAYSLTAAEAMGLLTFLCIILGVTALLLIWTPVLNRKKEVSRVSAFLILSLVGAITCSKASVTLSKESESTQKLSNTAYHSVAPSFSLWWSSRLFPHYDQLITQSLSLTPRYSVAEYQKKARASAKSSVAATRNVLLVVLESFRSDLLFVEHQGKEISPTVNQLAREGIWYSNAYAQSTESAYAFATLTSGQFPLRFRERYRLSREGPPFIPFYELLAQTHRTGYFYSGNAGQEIGVKFSFSPSLEIYLDANHVPCKAFDLPEATCLREIDEAKVKGGNLDDLTTTTYLNRWLTKVAAADDTKPFFALLALESAHFPYELGYHLENHFTPSELTPTEQNQISFVRYPKSFTGKMRNRYYNSIRYMDSMIRSVVTKLEELGLRDTTEIIITGDHGQLFHEHGLVTHGSYPFQEAIQVPLIVDSTRLSQNGERSEYAMHVDIPPTILSLVGYPPYSGFQGETLLTPGESGELIPTPPPTRPIFTVTQGYGEKNALLSPPWKLIYDHKVMGSDLFNIEVDPKEQQAVGLEYPELYTCMNNLLTRVRSSQLQYFADSALYENYFPPTYSGPTFACANSNEGLAP